MKAAFRLVQLNRERKKNQMHELINELPEIINRVFDVLELIVLRLALLGFVASGAYALLHNKS